MQQHAYKYIFIYIEVKKEHIPYEPDIRMINFYSRVSIIYILVHNIRAHRTPHNHCVPYIHNTCRKKNIIAHTHSHTEYIYPTPTM